ncbi:hypothetical protein GBF35_00120 [Nonomuraea phyllanthi]|uniref:hypothetical protein n=1 Tax=Nonomuraea phyllanthi TaxID=2219224 RepID=UPI001293AE38|nr:hypothetical protein [Nonomuraea phyllanthi]QFY05299.1 hypothetical protein GBF35_00120 [Nonomuraea phyllanthi]
MPEQPDELAFAEQELLGIAREVAKLGGGLDTVGTDHHTAAAATWAAVTDDEYGRAFRRVHEPRLEALNQLLTLLARQVNERVDEVGVQARGTYRRAEDDSTIRTAEA